MAQPKTGNADSERYNAWIAERVGQRVLGRDKLVVAISEHVEEETGEQDDAIVEALEVELDRLIAAAIEEELSWRETTNDRIEAAFLELTKVGFVAIQNAGYTIGDGWADVHELAAKRSDARAAVFYHGQDLERACEGKGLMLAYGSLEEGDPSEDAQPPESVGQEVCAVLKKHGVSTEWDGSSEQRIRIPPFAWQPRFWTKEPPATKRKASTKKRKAATTKKKAVDKMPATVPELAPSTLVLEIGQTPWAHGVVTRIGAAHGLSPLFSDAMHATPNHLTVAANVYDSEGGYDCCYLRFDHAGTFLASLKESLGVLPSLFTGPDGATWAVVLNPYGDRDRHIILPIEGRDRLKEAKRLVTAVASPVGNGYLCKRDPKGKADKLLPVVWSKGIAKRGKACPIEPPAHNAFSAGPDGMHGLVRTAAGVLLHRQFDETGAEVARRELSFTQEPDFAPTAPVSLSFTGPSTIVTASPGALRILTFSAEGELDSDNRLNLGDDGDVFGVNVAAHGEHLVVSYVGKARGWAYAKAGEWIEGVRQEDDDSWADVGTNEKTAFPPGDFVIPSIGINGAHYWVLLAPSRRGPEMFLVQRNLGA